MCVRWYRADSAAACQPLSSTPTMSRMAVVLNLNVFPATQEQFHVLDDRVGEAMRSAGGPPSGLLSHVVYPDDDGFVVSGVWRTETEGRDYVDEMLRPLVKEVGLTARETVCLPAWSFARP
jgi:hypothetical protein